MTSWIVVHLASAVSALVLGAAMLARPKGTQTHRQLGRVWVALAGTAALTSFGIRGLGKDGGYSAIHLLSVWTLISLACAVYFIRRGRVRSHRYFMIGTYVGLIGAGLGALAPGRMIARTFFGG